MITVNGLTKLYGGVRALDGVSFAIGENGLVFVCGKSGCGKSTLLNIIGGLDSPSGGDLLVGGVSVSGFSAAQYDNYRNFNIGFIFQEYNLLDGMTVGENIALALRLQGTSSTDEKVDEVLALVDLDGYGARMPSELSGGQRQRVAIARAIVKPSAVIIADEPTGALDSENSKQIFEILKRLSAQRLVIVASHDTEAAEKYADRVLTLSDGKLISDSGTDTPEAPAAAPAKKHRAALPLKTVLKFALGSASAKKLRLTAVILLSIVAFTLVGTADAFAAYSARDALARSLSDGMEQYVSLRKEKLIDYGSGAEWYGDGYMLTDGDIDGLREKTGCVAQGVYRPAICDLDIQENYAVSEVSAKNYYRRADRFSGFMELDADKATAFGIELVAGRFPDGDEYELAISRYVFDAFAEFGYRSYTGPQVCASPDIGLDADETRIPWEEWRVMPYGTDVSTRAFIGATVDNTEDFEVSKYTDIIGRTLFIGERNYTVTGVIDTHFDAEHFAGAAETDARTDGAKLDLKQTVKSGELEREQAFGIATLAFVGDGRVAEIASRYPRAVSFGDGVFKAESPDGHAFSVKNAVRLDGIDTDRAGISPLDVPLDGEFEPFDTLKDREIIIDLFSSAGAPPDIYINYDISLTYPDGRTSYYDKKVAVAGMVFSGFSRHCIYPVDDLVVVSDRVFESLTGGREGFWSFAVAALPRENVGTFVDSCAGYSDDTRFSVMNAMTFQMETLDGYIVSASRIARIVGFGLAVFAAVLMFNFISVSIAQKKSEIGIMRALGTGRRDVFRIFICEGLGVAAVNTLLACALTALVATVCNGLAASGVGLLFPLMSFGVRQIVLIAAVSFAVAIISGFIPIWSASRKKPIDAIRRAE